MAFRRWALIVAAMLAGPAAAQADFAVPPPPTRADYLVARDAPTRPGKAGDVTLNYFFDYQCPVCRTNHADVRAVLAADRGVRVIYRDTPIFGPRSETAARLALAARYQRRHEAFHAALMTQKLPLDAVALRQAAQVAGLDWARLERDLATHRAAIDRQLAWNDELSRAAGIRGTPAFIVGRTLIDGAADRAMLGRAIAKARRATPNQRR